MATDTKQPDVEKLQKDIDDLKSAISTLTKDLQNTADDRGQRLGAAAREKLDEFGRSASGVARKAADRGRESAEYAAETIRERPLQSLLVAFGAGLLLAKLLDRR